MAKRNDTCNTDFILRIYRGITVSLPFTYTDENDVPINLTGKTVTFKLRFGNNIYTYTDTPNTYGSKTEVTDDVAGEFLVLVTDEETAELDEHYTTGSWAVILNDGGNADLLWRGTVTVEDL